MCVYVKESKICARVRVCACVCACACGVCVVCVCVCGACVRVCDTKVVSLTLSIYICNMRHLRETNTVSQDNYGARVDSRG